MENSIFCAVLLICFLSLGMKYLHDMNISFVKVGRGNLAKKVYKDL